MLYIKNCFILINVKLYVSGLISFVCDFKLCDFLIYISIIILIERGWDYWGVEWFEIVLWSLIDLLSYK